MMRRNYSAVVAVIKQSDNQICGLALLGSSAFTCRRRYRMVCQCLRQNGIIQVTQVMYFGLVLFAAVVRCFAISAVEIVQVVGV